MRPLTDERPLTELRPLTDDSPLTELRPLTDESPLTELRPLTDDSPLTDESPRSWVPVSMLPASSPQPIKPTMAPSARLIWMVRFPSSFIWIPPLRRPGRLRESRWLCVARSLGVCVCSQGVGSTQAVSKAVIKPTFILCIDRQDWGFSMGVDPPVLPPRQQNRCYPNNVTGRRR